MIASLLLTAAALTPVTSIARPVEIKFSHVVAENTPKGLMAEKFKELVEERMPGKVKVSVYPNSQLFNDNKVLEAMLLGDVQMAAPSLSKFQSFTKKLQVFDLPFLFKDIDAVDRFQQSETGQELLGSLKKRGLVGLGYLHNGMKQLSSNEKIVTPDQIAGKKFRIMTSDVLQAQFEQVDAIPLKKPFSEVFTLLQTRAIDGQENTWSNTYSKKFYEVQPYITASNHGVLDYMVVTSAEFWMTLPDDLRTEIKRAMDDAIAYGNAISKKKADEDRQLIAESGVTEIIDLTDAQRQAWVAAMKPVWKKFERQVGKDVIQAAEASNE
ncbi:TRAP transporter substrate-binding protein [Alteromonas confluentis]|uniref:C4-dicarboxylate ABC transporter n=1 Tax=Alteromonas confluentis TaxID=1656094 RepID=A0A1E7ZGK4_9ALTE|nr:TRAP transporter substrate-binding protein [Alteromonas confluentis]OFC72584.1 C4-dicarboxylate ABC transporter [Alteromonas confluentis]